MTRRESVLAPPAILATDQRKLVQPRLHPGIDSVVRHDAPGVGCARGQAREQLDRLVDGLHPVNGELFSANRVEDVLAQHQVGHVGGRDENTLIAGETSTHTDVEKALHLLVHRADGLHAAELIHGSGRARPAALRKRGRRLVRNKRNRRGAR